MEASSGVSLIAAGLVIDFVMTFVMLWASAEVMGRRRTRHRLALGAATATAFVAVILLLVGYGVIEFLSVSTILIALASILASVYVSFSPLKPGDLVRLSVLALFFTLLAAGVTMAVNIYTGGWMVGTGWDMITSLIIAVGSVLLVAELGWGIVHKRMRETLYFVPIRILLGSERIETNALIDTGNQLRDPLTGAPVVIVEYELIKKAIPGEALAAFENRSESPYELLASLSSVPDWARRVRLIPFTSLGKEKGMLIGIRPDCLEIFEGQVGLSITNVILGVHPRHLSTSNEYQALLHPELLATV
jgi:stage II sporulation protein GA (sporulation sigma-E factor processing peptidase)